MKNYYIDLGSSTIKVYCYEQELKLIEEHSIYFKNDFDAEKGISESNLKELCDYFEKIKSKYNLDSKGIAIIGDQFMTDMGYGYKGHITKIFVDPLATKDLKITNINRYLEEKIMSKYSKNNLFKKGKYYE